MKFYIHKYNDMYWELVHRGISIKSKYFNTENEIYDDLSKTLSDLESLDVTSDNISSLLFFKFTETNGKYSWVAWSKFSSIFSAIVFDEQHGFTSYEEACRSAFWFKDSILNTRPCYPATSLETGDIPIPLNLFNRKM